MLILSTALLLAQQTVSPPDQAEIVVIGRRLANWTGTYRIRGAKVRCSTKVSSGDHEIDDLGCRAFEDCAGQMASQIAATDRKSLAQETRLAMKDIVKADLFACVAKRRIALIEALATERQNRHGITAN